ncbi:hypothetical protein [Jannaschia sp. CCS1]|uniref:hypothetical protein n=1 Tax=Jannaschia sp. (strain CCS1) TaxID=290400 RepID=UPI000053B002|nr:hypothetical protein [Jannaschia sp. CCS1]ABD53747.1 hypothetical protein Jann_0830 [Jannaschia sp. CCS1]
MRPIVFALAICTIAAPACAQDEPIYAPCVTRFPAPEEFGTGGAFTAALEAQGWVMQTSDAARLAAAAPLADIEALVFAPDAFADAADALDYASRAMTRYEPQMVFIEIFTRAGLSASLSAVELDPGYVTVRCTFAGPEVPSVKDFLDTDRVLADGSAARVRLIPQDTPDGVVTYSIVAFQFDGDDTTLAPITGREGLQTSFIYRVPE